MHDMESYLISQLTSRYIGDDGAVVGDMVYSMDAFCEGVHFQRAWMTPAQVGTKAMLVNLSDAIAMNADPLYALVSVSIPKDFDYEQTDALLKALEVTAAHYGCEIIGGDTVGGERLHLSITIISKSDNPLLRTGLKEGDLFAYTGTLGRSRRDLERLMRGESVESTSPFFVPPVRQKFVKEARAYLRCGMDISDGLFCDTNKLLEANEMGAEIFTNINYEIGFSGEEYEMLVAFDPAHKERLQAIAKTNGTTLTVFGEAAKNDFRFPCKSHHFG